MFRISPSCERTSPSQARILSTISCLTRMGKEHPNGHLRTRVTRPLLHRRGPREVWFRRRTYRVKPSANVHLSVGFPAVVPCAGCICGLRVPFENSELRIAALNHKPVNRIAGYRSTDFTSEFLKRCHEILIRSKAPGDIVTRPSCWRPLAGSVLRFRTLPLAREAILRVQPLYDARRSHRAPVSWLNGSWLGDLRNRVHNRR